MNIRWMAVIAVLLVATFVIGYRVSYSSGIQPGYFEKAEAPAYGVGGGGGEDLGIGQEAQDYFKKLYQEEEQ